ncbi:MAG TPA: hypothetical protein VLI39_10305, partial [Sedimentisphaerales bacterium]|nr:hypothetical protein [Sedimentisphaerales bacterium]
VLSAETRVINTASNAVNDHPFSQKASGSAALLLRPATRRTFAPPFTPKHHRLKDLWVEAKGLIRRHYGEDTPPEIDYIDPCIEEFHEHDPESFSFRYPTDKKGNLNLGGLSHINLRNLYETMDRLTSFLDCIGGDLGQKLESMSDH